MTAKRSHVLVRDGSARLGGSRPAPPARPADHSSTYRGGVDDFFGGGPDAKYNGGSFPLAESSDVAANGRSASVDQRGWEALPGGRPSPREQAQRPERKT
jgi:hypothetical protein